MQTEFQSPIPGADSSTLYNPGSTAGKSLRLLLAIFLSGVLSTGCTREKKEDNNWIYFLTSLHGIQRILVIGDSLTHYSDAFSLQEKLGDRFEVRRASLPGSTFPHWTDHMDEAFSRSEAKPPDLICVPLGTNDGTLFDSAAFVENLRAFHEALRIRSVAPVLYVQVPRTRNPGHQEGILTNNGILPSTLQELQGDQRLVDVDTPFEEAPNRDLLYGIDPIHPTEAGYSLFGETLKTAILKGGL